MCKRCEESKDHFFLHCEIASVLWTVIFNCAGFTWVKPRRVVDLFACRRRLSGNPQSATVWKMVSSCLLWYICRERKCRSFEDHERMVVDLKSFNTLFHWAATSDFPYFLSFHDFIGRIFLSS
jgi:hypothetical protein